MSDIHKISLVVNGRQVEAEIESRVSLADFLRKHLRLTGTHLGCEHGVCGACTVLVDGASVRSCLMLAVQAGGRSVETIEGLARGEALHPIQEALARHHGLQCGFCTPGVAMTIKELVVRPCQETCVAVPFTVAWSQRQRMSWTPMRGALVMRSSRDHEFQRPQTGAGCDRYLLASALKGYSFSRVCLEHRSFPEHPRVGFSCLRSQCVVV